MGFLSSLFGQPAPTADDADRLLAEGRAALWRGEAKLADQLLGRAALGHRRPAVALAYQSLARRMQLKFPAALQLAKKAIERDERCFEAYSALAAAELSLKRIVEATVAFDQSSPRVPFDLDGHALRLLTVALFAEAIANMVEDDEGLQIDFLLTPATLCVIRILDGDPHLGVKHAEMEDSVPAALALGAAYYFLGRPQRARSEWKRCESAFPADGRNAPIRLSLARLMSGSP